MRVRRFGMIWILSAVLAMVPAIAGPTRSCLMGMTTFPYDYTIEAMDETLAFVGLNADLIAFHHDGGVPWPEALAGDGSYHPSVIAEIDREALAASSSHRVFVSVTPTDQNRNAQLASYWGADHGLPLPPEWQNKTLDDPEVVEAYTNWCRYLINRLDPDYFAFTIEASFGLTGIDDPGFGQLLAMASQVYPVLKAENPGLPVFMTFTTTTLAADQTAYFEEVGALLPYSDILAVSVYPYGLFLPGGIDVHEDPATIPAEYLSALAALAPGMPLGIAETGFPAQDVVIPEWGIDLAGSEQWQSDYVQKLMTDCDALGAEFVIWFLPRDHDLLNQRLMNLGIPLDPFAHFFWRDDGLLAGNGDERPALTTWRDWLAMPRRRPSDINRDGAIDTADLGLLIGAFGGSGFLADLNDDGAVDTADLGILLGDFQEAAPIR